MNPVLAEAVKNTRIATEGKAPKIKRGIFSTISHTIKKHFSILLKYLITDPSTPSSGIRDR
jgi:hypothetical protein